MERNEHNVLSLGVADAASRLAWMVDLFAHPTHMERGQLRAVKQVSSRVKGSCPSIPETSTPTFPSFSTRVVSNSRYLVGGKVNSGGVNQSSMAHPAAPIIVDVLLKVVVVVIIIVVVWRRG